MTTVHPALSFELFPPRSHASCESLIRTIAELESTNPDYVSVTYSGDAKRRQKTLALLDYLVELIRRVEREDFAHLAAGKVSIGVAAYPQKHPESASLLQDIEILLSKQRAGADFAITQVFFEDERYSALVDSARLAGVDIPIIPGIMPVTSLKRLQNLCQMAGMEVPTDLAYALETATSSAELHRIGVDYALNQCRAVMDAGAPGLHFFTFNEHAAVLDVLDQLDLPRYSNRFSQSLSELEFA
ncbi:MAG: methylenetetrahydrofolate reductase [Rothia mucilaginosa]|uniref:methylenetetrahydrofolate reductase n=1 Tax=Rothia mucilaginosa TaxID=43675 RepID=UPI001D255531|nr:methylenetetrahydrofolate reductase [Rothia mucilaginosa]MBS6433933.1 methylenetetrahydrofolate reductase [Rothia mucilaginosa]